ncbi:hypothetical protein OS175_12760 [Marinicella sp. S1101]|uniref:hypothetical protein n=1 Tax=Marinicella marina TaxID=2996016 RepID=UPI0022609BEB|nr:hypothetical protein [Marinicella marina]MCX7554745.1 hypothetical protein [Marinicella marina]MDJ1141439.1 hypothetical protein [Marinicella marina]
MQKNHLIIWLLATFLIIYHTFKIYAGLVSEDDAAAAVLSWSYENSVRLWLIFSLMLVIMFKRVGLVSMWLAIFTLIGFLYANLSGLNSLLGYAAPLKELIIPVLLTWVYWHNARMSHQ